MISFFLRAKAWQVFALHFIAPFCFNLVVISTVMQQLRSSQSTQLDPEQLLNLFRYLPLVLIFSVGTQLCWTWAVVVGLHKYLPTQVSINLKRFKWFFFYIVLYFPLTISLFLYLIRTALFNNPSMSQYLPVGLLIILPLHLFAVFCMLHNAYIAAKTLKAVERKTVLRNDECIGEFFMILVFAIGVWFIQPRVNRLADRTTAM